MVRVWQSHGSHRNRFAVAGQNVVEREYRRDDTEIGGMRVQRGTMHAWAPVGPEPAVFAFVLIDADPVEIGGKKLTTDYPSR